MSKIRGLRQATACNHKRTATARTLTLLAAAVVAAGGLSLGAGTAEAQGAACLWAGGAYGQGSTVVAGGWNFFCGTDGRGAPYWHTSSWHRGDARRGSTVPNPGAYTNPAGLFSAGARQFGTDYNDYCVGNQLIEGSEDVYQVVADGRGALYWKAAGPIDQWAFDPGTGPRPSWRSSGSCHDGSLI
ncbi:hypothetical protein IU459_23980 [Nocardia amamiensis]|uniref:Uncharacterized protein n=1 Tax=Nocardia amamiensis TaxID=404578 RepID=A0ABS0CVF0_9NOCA|nr:hypothetical protein [Nocardia amamiensis]MBF6300580.1 hypothetical protein [Nocardia amamiensis]